MDYEYERNGAAHTTYVAERNLEPDTERRPVAHPLLGEVFERFENGAYLPRRGRN